MNTAAISRRLQRPLTEPEAAALRSLTPLAEVLGARDWGLGWRIDAHLACTACARWYGYALLPGGERLNTNDHHQSPEDAAEALGAAMLAHLSCPYCLRPIATGLAVGCPWRRFGERWRPGCLSNPPRDTLPIHAPAGKDETA